MPEEYRAAPRAPFRSDGSPAGPPFSIPQMAIEVNVADVFRHKIKQLVRFYSTEAVSSDTKISLRRCSATQLDHIAAGSVDDVFTDPPFGSNIFYANCNIIIESWFDAITPVKQEAVVNRSLKPAAGGKTVEDYGELMAESFSEIGRILKPGGWANVVFQNAETAIWEGCLHL